MIGITTMAQWNTLTRSGAFFPHTSWQCDTLGHEPTRVKPAFDPDTARVVYITAEADLESLRYCPVCGEFLPFLDYEPGPGMAVGSGALAAPNGTLVTESYAAWRARTPEGQALTAWYAARPYLR